MPYRSPRHRTLAAPWHHDPHVMPGLRAFLRRVPWRLIVFCLGLVVQAVLLWLVWQLIDLCISLLEAWELLARYIVGA